MVSSSSSQDLISITINWLSLQHRWCISQPTRWSNGTAVMCKSGWRQHFGSIKNALFIFINADGVMLQGAWLVSHEAAGFLLLHCSVLLFLNELILIKKTINRAHIKPQINKMDKTRNRDSTSYVQLSVESATLVRITKKHLNTNSIFSVKQHSLRCE